MAKSHSLLSFSSRMVKESIKIREGMCLNFIMLPFMSLPVALGLTSIYFSLSGEHNIIFVILGSVFLFIGLMPIYEAFYRTSILKIDKKGIKLRRKSYSYHICHKDVKSILLYDSWIFVQQSDNMVRPIDLFFFKYDLQDIKDTLTSISTKNNFNFSTTDQKHTVDKFLENSAQSPKEKTYKLKSDKGAKLFMYIGFFLFTSSLSIGSIFLLAKEISFSPFFSIFIFGGMSFVCYHSIKDELKRKEYSIVLNMATLEIEGKVYEWNEFRSIEATYRYKTPLMIHVNVANNDSIEIKNFNVHELAEQFTFFGRRLIQVRGLRK